MNNAEWLDTPPPPEDLRTKDGALYIPYHIIVGYLNKLCKTWSTSNFNHLYYTLKNGKTLVSGNIDIHLTYNIETYDLNEKFKSIIVYKEITRTLSGAATFSLSKSSNPHPAASVKSLCIMNAVKPISVRFGWGLNGFETESVYFPDEDVPDVFTEKSDFEKSLDDCQTIADLTPLKGNLSPAQQKLYMNKLKELSAKK